MVVQIAKRKARGMAPTVLGYVQQKTVDLDLKRHLHLAVLAPPSCGRFIRAREITFLPAIYQRSWNTTTPQRNRSLVGRNEVWHPIIINSSRAAHTSSDPFSLNPRNAYPHRPVRRQAVGNTQLRPTVLTGVVPASTDARRARARNTTLRIDML